MKDHKYNLIKIFGLLSKIKNVQGNRFRYWTYKNIVYTIDKLKHVHSIDDLKNRPKIGEETLLKAEEIIKTGTLEQLNNIDKKTKALIEFESIMGIGLQKAKQLVRKGIYKIEDIPKKELNKTQLLGIKYRAELEKPIEREKVKKIYNLIKKEIKGKSLLVGSYARKKKFMNDIDILGIEININDIKNRIENKKYFLANISVGKTRYSFLIKKGKIIKRVDIFTIKKENLYTAKLHFCGSAMFIRNMRIVARKKGFLLNQYGLFKNNKKIKINSERDIFTILKIDFTPVSKR